MPTDNTTQKKKKVYLAGKLTGNMAELTMNYENAKLLMEQHGFEVVNPMDIMFSEKTLAELNKGEGPVIYRHLISQMLISDLVVLMPGFDHKKSIETDICEVFHIPFYPFNHYLKPVKK